MKNKENLLKRLYIKFKGFESLIEISSGFLIMLACIITLPYLNEFQLTWLGSFIIFMVAIKIIINDLERNFPDLKIKYEKDKFKKEISQEIKDIKKEIKKLKDEIKKEKQ